MSLLVSLQESQVSCHSPCVPSLPLQLYAVAVKDLVRKTDKIYKVKTRNSTVEYTIKKLEPGGKYHVIVQLGNMSKESSMKINTGKGASIHMKCCPTIKPTVRLLPGHTTAPSPCKPCIGLIPKTHSISEVAPVLFLKWKKSVITVKT